MIYINKKILFMSLTGYFILNDNKYYHAIMRADNKTFNISIEKYKILEKDISIDLEKEYVLKLLDDDFEIYLK